jgi:hypothetical protein
MFLYCISTATELEQYTRTIERSAGPLIFSAGAERYTCMLRPAIALITRITFNAYWSFLETTSAPSVVPFPAGRLPLWRGW